MSSSQKQSIFQLKVTLAYSELPIWRRIKVEADINLYKLHAILQIAMGWTNSHLHQFIAGDVYYAVPMPDDYGFELETEDERQYSLNQLMKEPGDKILYEYDFGDGWLHEIKLEKIVEPSSSETYPCCIKGKLACPPEDIGGPFGYYEFLGIINDKNHPDRDSYLEWAGGSFDPDEFDLEKVNYFLGKLEGARDDIDFDDFLFDL